MFTPQESRKQERLLTERGRHLHKRPETNLGNGGGESLSRHPEEKRKALVSEPMGFMQ